MSPRRKSGASSSPSSPARRVRATDLAGPDIMRELRHSLPVPLRSAARFLTQHRVAYVLRVHPRTVARWEEDGAPVPHAWAYVGLAFRLGGEEAARRTLSTLTQSELYAEPAGV